MKTFLILATLSILSSCTNERESQRTLENFGFSNVRFTGYNFFSGGKGDTFSTGFCAENPNGKEVCGTVCCGLMKDCTIRF